MTRNGWSAVTRHRGATLSPGAVAVVFVYGAIASSLAPYSRPIEVATTVPIGLAVAIAIARGWHHRHLDEPGRPREPVLVGTVVVWIAMIAVTAGLAYSHYQSQPRTVYPTLSSIASTVFSELPGMRAVAFAFWVWLGWYLLDR